MNCKDCTELYKERNLKAPCDSCIINLEAEQEQANAEYLCAEEQAQAEAEEMARQEESGEYL
jgi:hypothetical protein